MASVGGSLAVAPSDLAILTTDRPFQNCHTVERLGWCKLAAADPLRVPQSTESEEHCKFANHLTALLGGVRAPEALAVPAMGKMAMI